MRWNCTGRYGCVWCVVMGVGGVVGWGGGAVATTADWERVCQQAGFCKVQRSAATRTLLKGITPAAHPRSAADGWRAPLRRGRQGRAAKRDIAQRNTIARAGRRAAAHDGTVVVSSPRQLQEVLARLGGVLLVQLRQRDQRDRWCSGSRCGRCQPAAGSDTMELPSPGPRQLWAFPPVVSKPLAGTALAAITSHRRISAACSHLNLERAHRCFDLHTRSLHRAATADYTWLLDVMRPARKRC